MSDTLNSTSGLRPVSDSISNGVKPEPASNDQKQGLSVSSQVVVGPIKKVDFGNSDAVGDVARASIDKAAGKGPREGMNQFALSGKEASAARSKSFPSDQGAVNS
jgi:hypothetical protein